MELQELHDRSNYCLTEEDYHVKSRRHAGILVGCHIFVEIYGSYWTNYTPWIVYGKQNDFDNQTISE